MSSAFERMLATCSFEELEKIKYDWSLWRRHNQVLPSPGKRWTLYNAGRGWGKTRTGAEITRDRVHQGITGNGLIIGYTPTYVETSLIDGLSGIRTCTPPAERPVYKSRLQMLQWPNGAVAHIRSGAEPDKIRSINADWVWIDELAFLDYPEKTWEQANIVLRIASRDGSAPRGIITTTPTRRKPMPELFADDEIQKVAGATFENTSLDPDTLLAYRKMYAGTSTERQELYGELLLEEDGALWKQSQITDCRSAFRPTQFLKNGLILSVDPAIAGWGASGSDNKDLKLAEVGIILKGVAKDQDGKPKIFVLEDLSVSGSVSYWRDKLCDYYSFFKPDFLVAESNQGGEMIRTLIHDKLPGATVHLRSARIGKRLRAAPISLLYQQGLVKHCGKFPILEEQMCTYLGLPSERSPDRLDALVWGCAELRALVQHLPATISHIPGIESYSRSKEWV